MSQTKRNIIANFAGKGWSALMALAFVPVYIKLLGVECYGLIGFYLSLLALVSVLDLGLSTTLNRELARTSAGGDPGTMRDLVRTLELVYWAIALALGAVVVLCAPLIAHHWIHASRLSSAAVHQTVVIMGFALAMQWPSALYSGGLMGLQRQVVQNVISASGATLRGVGAALILWLVSPTIQAFFLWQIAISLAQTAAMGLGLWACLPRAPHPARFRSTLLTGISRFAAGMTGISIVAALLTQFDKIVLSRVLTLEMFGYYSVAVLIASSIAYLVAPVFAATFPRFSELARLRDEVSLAHLYHRTAQLLAIVIFPVMTIVAVFSNKVLLLWTGNAAVAQSAHLVLMILVIGSALNGLMNVPYALQLAHGWTRLPLFMNIGSAVVLLPLLIYMALKYGAVGAAAVWLLLNLGYIVIDVQIMHRRLLPGQQWRWYREDFGFPLLASLAATFLAKGFVDSFSARLPSIIALLTATAFAFAAASMAAPEIRASLFGRLASLRRLSMLKATYWS